MLEHHQPEPSFLKDKEETIRSFISNPASGYLFSGKPKNGKRLLANFFANTLLCEKKFTTTCCTTCNACRLYMSNTHPDYYEVSLEQNKQNINFEQITMLRDSLKIKNSIAEYAVALITNADMLTHPAANALLKILEEPNGKTVFILLDNAEQTVLPTIISRCQKISFKPLSIQAIEKLLKHQKVSKSVTVEIAFLSMGRPLYALELSQNSQALIARKKEFDQHIENITLGVYIPQRAKNSETISWSQKQISARKILEDYKYIWHNIVLYKLGLATYLKTYHNQVAFKSFIQTIDLKIAIRKLRVIQRAEQSLSSSVPGDILIEHVL